jgi:hypothetical protein
MPAALALTGCANPDAPAGSAGEPASAAAAAAAPRSAGEPAAPAAPTPASQAPADVQATPQAALAAFAQIYVNWTFQTLTGRQLTLAAMSVGAARIAEQQAAASSRADSTISQGHIFNTGRVVSIAPDRLAPGMWIVVTREQTGGDSQYEGLPAGYHVTLAQLAAVPGGYAVTQWLPQS